MKRKFLYFLLMLIFQSVFAVVPKTYTNPVIPGFFPDPSTIRVGSDYYTVNSTMMYFPGIAISHSKDLVNWHQVGYVFEKSTDIDLVNYFDGMGIWAPDISYYEGEFYIFYCTVQLSKDRKVNIRGNYMVKSKSISGPWSKPVQLTDYGNDPSHFIDDDGQHYMLYAAGIPIGNGTKIVKLNHECTQVIGESKWLETEGKKAAPEGPHMLKRNGFYYLLMASSGGLYPGHHMLVARSKSIYGPYENSPFNPYLIQKDTCAINFHQGHGKFIETQNGEWFTTVISQRWIKAELNGLKKGISQLGRETSLYRINWTQDYWPVVCNGKGPLDTDIRPNLPWTPQINITNDDFNSPKLHRQWMFRRNPDYKNLSLSERRGHLRIYTGSFDIDTIAGRNLIVQRECWLKYTAVIKMTFNPVDCEQAGLTGQYDSKTWVRLGLQRDDSRKLVLILEECRNGKKTIIKNIPDIKSSTLYLKMSVNKLQRSFFFSYDNNIWFDSGVLNDTAFLSDQGTPNWGFTGTMVGVYSFNRGSGRRIPADFDWFRIIKSL